MTHKPRPELEALLADAEWMRRLARSLTRDPDEAAELAQDAWVAVIGAGRAGGGAGARRGWLRAVLRNLLWTRRRDDARRKGRELDVARPERAPDAAAELERMELQAELARAILELDEPYRSAVVLRHMDGLCNAAIAERQGTSTLAARQRVSRGLALLRERLDRERGRKGWLPSLLLLAGAPPASKPLESAPWATALATAAATVAVITWASWPLANPPVSPAAIAPMREAALAAALGPADPIPAFAEPTRVARVAQQAPPAAPAPPLSGVVVDEGGAPLEEVLVELLPLAPPRQASLAAAIGETPRSPLALATTDVHGVFHLKLWGELAFELHASAPRRAGVHLPLVRPGDAPRLVLRLAAAVEGLIVSAEDGSPLADARVTVSGVFPDAGFRRATLGDGGGRFRFEGLVPAVYRVSATAPGYVAQPYPRRPEWIEARGGETARAILALERGTKVHGRVTDGRTGVPLAGCRVFEGRIHGHETFTDAAGSYELDGLEIGTTALGAVVAHVPGYGRWERPYRSMPPQGMELDFQLLPARSARGRLEGPDGKAVEGALVVALARAYDEYGQRTETVCAWSGADGAFELEGLRPDLRHALHVEAPGLAIPLLLFPEDELHADPVELGDVILAEAAVLAGRVVDEHDRPIAGIVVSQELEDDWRAAPAVTPGRLPSVVTCSQGRFVFPRVAPGLVRLSTSRKGLVGGDQLRFQVYAGEPIEGIVLRVSMAGSIAGRVLDSAGLPAVQASVELYPAESDRERWDSRATYTLTDGVGRFAFHGLVDSEYGIHASGLSLMLLRLDSPLQGRSTRMTAATGTQDLLLVLEEAGTITGTLRDAEGEPVAARMVLLYPPGEKSTDKIATTGWDGGFRFVVPRGSAYTLSVPNALAPGEHLRLPDVREGAESLDVRLPDRP